MASHPHRGRPGKDGRPGGYYQRAHRQSPNFTHEQAAVPEAEVARHLLLRLEVNDQVLEVPLKTNAEGLNELLELFVQRLELSFHLSLTLRLRVLLEVQRRRADLVEPQVLDRLLDLYKEKVINRRRGPYTSS